jgi:sulfur relay (sulfurtransferase) complex TusBCD TusD component (DsrE family)
MDGRGKKLGVLLSAGPEEPNFKHAIGLAQTALAAGVEVYLYCIDDAVLGVDIPELQALKERGLKLYACAYGTNRRQLPLTNRAAFAGLATVSDLIAATDRFVSFN